MKQRAWEGIIIGILVIALYAVSLKYDLYYIFPYIDWVQHFFGGVGLGLLLSALFKNNVKKVLGTVFSIAIAWELFERIGHIYLPAYINYGGTGDTIIDVLCAIIGASLVLLATRE